MSDADDILLTFLRSAGVEIPDKASSCAQLDSPAVFSACAHCLNEIAQESGDTQPRLPVTLTNNPGARFRACTAMAAAITKLGFDGEVGFNLFLYPSEAEVRRVLLFLVDQMPKGGDGDGESETGGLAGTASLDGQVRQALLRGLNDSWKPPAWTARRVLKPERAAYLRGSLARSALGSARRAERQAALEERLNALGGGGGGGVEDSARSGGFGDLPGGSGGPPIGVGGSGPVAVGGLFAHSAMFAHDTSSSAGAHGGGDDGDPAETAAQRAERAEREKLGQAVAELDGLLAALDEQRKVLDASETFHCVLTYSRTSLTSSLSYYSLTDLLTYRKVLEASEAAEATVADAVRVLEAATTQNGAEAAKREAEHGVRRKALELATDPQGSRVRLQKASAQGAAALMQLAEEWEAHRAPLLENIRGRIQAREQRRSGAVAKMAHVKHVRARTLPSPWRHRAAATALLLPLLCHQGHGLHPTPILPPPTLPCTCHAHGACACVH